MCTRLAVAVALGLASLAVPGAAARASAISISSGIVDIGAVVLVSGVTDAGPRPLVTLAPVGGGKSWKARATREGADTWLDVKAPSGEYDVTVATRGGPVAAGRLTVRPPRIVRLIPPEHASPKADYLVIGANFGTKRGRVLVGGVPAKVGRWKNDGLRFRVKKLTSDATDLAIETATSSVSAPCALLVCGASDAPGTTSSAATRPGDASGHPVWRLDWKPGQSGESSAHMTSLWKWSTTVYDPVKQTLLFETEVDGLQKVGGIYLMVSHGGWVPEDPDVTAELFYEPNGAAPRISVFAYKSRGLGEHDADGWSVDPSKPADFIVSSLTDPHFVLASEDTTGADGTRRLGFLIDVSTINAHKPMYGKTDGSVWTGLTFGDAADGSSPAGSDGANAGLWSYIFTDPKAVYDAEGHLTSWHIPKWGTYPGEDGPFFHAESVPSTSVDSPLMDTVTETQAQDEILPAIGGTLVVVRGNADRSDVLVGTTGNDAIRPGAGGDEVTAGTGDDIVLVDAASAGAVIDGGYGGTDVLQLMRDPLAETDPSSAAPWGLTLILDPVVGGAAPVPQSVGDSTIVLGTDVSGRIELPGGGTIAFRGLEQIRF